MDYGRYPIKGNKKLTEAKNISKSGLVSPLTYSFDQNWRSGELISRKIN